MPQDLLSGSHLHLLTRFAANKRGPLYRFTPGGGYLHRIVRISVDDLAKLGFVGIGFHDRLQLLSSQNVDFAFLRRARNRSAITFGKNIHTPVLFVLGESDYRTPQDSGGEQLFRALKYMNVQRRWLSFHASRTSFRARASPGIVSNVLSTSSVGSTSG